ncbi:MFS transporter [Paraburkholderia dipogonis]|uniref:MFS transporter n=3 Tax=Paraburkholderia dipogonis TaxID=1211383 RepID=A0A4Y8ML82_9BURK|nr:MFS transporter [Paraburkholderia dipogonis]
MHRSAYCRAPHAKQKAGDFTLQENNAVQRYYPWLLVVVLFCTSVVSYLDRNIISLFVGPIRNEIGLSDVQVSLLQGIAFALFYSVMGLPFGRLVDHRTRKNLIAAGVLLWSVMTICCGLSTTFWQLFFSRMGVGIGEACLGPAAFSMIADCFAPAQRGRAIASYNMSNYVGVGASLLFGGAIISMLTQHTDFGLPGISGMPTWRLAFLISGLPGILMAFAVLALKEPQRREVMHTTGGHRGKVGLWSYLSRRTRAFVSIYTVYTLTAMIGYIIVAWAPSFYIRHHHMRPANVGLLMGGMTIVSGVTGCLCGGYLTDLLASGGIRGGRFRLPLVWWPIAVASIIGMVCTSDPTLSLFFLGLLTFGSALSFSGAATVIQDVVPNQLRGQAAALNYIWTGIIGLSLGPTSVAMVTQYVLKDSSLLGNALVIVIVPLSVIGFFACYLGQDNYQKARDDLIAMLHTDTDTPATPETAPENKKSDARQQTIV